MSSQHLCERPVKKKLGSLEHYPCSRRDELLRVSFHWFWSVHDLVSTMNRCPCMWLQRWHPSGDLPCLFHRQTLMLVQLYDGLATSQDAHPTGLTHSYGVCFHWYRSPWSTNGAWASAWRFVRRGSSRMLIRKISRRMLVNFYVVLRFTIVSPSFEVAYFILKFLFVSYTKTPETPWATIRLISFKPIIILIFNVIFY